MKRLVLVGILFVGLISTAFGQSLSIESADETVNVNSSAVSDYSGHVTIKNISSAAVDVYCKRQIFGSNWCAFDSAYFCWDLCYGNETNQSIGTLEILPGQSNNLFSGHVYSPNTGASCEDSIRYTFYDSKNVNDSVSIVIKYQASDVFSVKEEQLPIGKVYPNPANNVLFVELNSQDYAGYTLEVYNLLGAKVRSTAINSNRVQLNVADLHAGIYLCTVSKNGTAVETRKIVVKH